MTVQRRQQLSRDDRIRVLILREAGKSYAEIANILAITQRQVQHTVNAGHPTPKKRSGRPELLSESQKKELVEFVCANDENRMMSYTALAKGPFAHWNVSEYPIRRALEGAGFKRYPLSADGRRQERERIRRLRPIVTRRHRKNRHVWAEKHGPWRIPQWGRILWTLEVWVSGVDRNGELRLKGFGELADLEGELELEEDGSVHEGGDEEDGLRADSDRDQAPSARLDSRDRMDGPTDGTADQRMPTAPMQTHLLATDPSSDPGSASASAGSQAGPSQGATKPASPTTPDGSATPPGQPQLLVWSSFYGTTPGPIIVWDDDWGAITQSSYMDRIGPVIKQVVDRARQEAPAEEPLRLMQDSTAPYHRSKATVSRLVEMGVQLLDDGAKWPAQSPDLNPLVDVWEWVSDYVRDECVVSAPRNSRELQALVERAWRHAVTPERLETVLAEMPDRCQAVIGAKGGWTHWWKPRKSRAPAVPPSAIAASTGLAQGLARRQGLKSDPEDQSRQTVGDGPNQQLPRRPSHRGPEGSSEGAPNAEAGVGGGGASEPPSTGTTSVGATSAVPAATLSTLAPIHHFPHHIVLNERGIPVAIPLGMPVPVGMTPAPGPFPGRVMPMAMPALPVVHPYPHFPPHPAPPPPTPISHPAGQPLPPLVAPSPHGTATLQPPPLHHPSLPPPPPPSGPATPGGHSVPADPHAAPDLPPGQETHQPHSAYPVSHHMQIQQRIFSHIQAQFQARAPHPHPLPHPLPHPISHPAAHQHMVQPHSQYLYSQQHHLHQPHQNGAKAAGSGGPSTPIDPNIAPDEREHTEPSVPPSAPAASEAGADAAVSGRNQERPEAGASPVPSSKTIDNPSAEPERTSALATAAAAVAAVAAVAAGAGSGCADITSSPPPPPQPSSMLSPGSSGPPELKNGLGEAVPAVVDSTAPDGADVDQSSARARQQSPQRKHSYSPPQPESHRPSSAGQQGAATEPFQPPTNEMTDVSDGPGEENGTYKAL